jgi:hypothetical protein
VPRVRRRTIVCGRRAAKIFRDVGSGTAARAGC